jgi:peptidoglycan hydrolase-like protein with peptidoglycan-binding domain
MAGVLLEQGSTGSAVTQLKRQLAGWFDGHLPGVFATLHVSGNDVFGANLQRAVVMFQAQVGLEVDGRAGQHTLDALLADAPRAAPKPKDLAFSPGLRRGASGLKVRLLQGWLTLQGFGVVVDDDFRAATEQAVKGFQQRRGLPVTGEVDRPTWNALVRPMLAALTPLKPAPPSRLFVAYARQHVRQSPREAGGDNRGPWVRLYTQGREGDDFPWCAGFATFVLRQACNTAGLLEMPVTQTLRCDEMATSAGTHFVQGGTSAAIARLRPGGFFLVRAAPGGHHKYSHCGIVAAPSAETMATIEGNTNDNGSSDGFEVLARTRDYTGKDFIVF